MKVAVAFTLLILNIVAVHSGPESRSLLNELNQTKEKLSRSETQKKIDSQLLFAIEQMRGPSSSTPAEPIKLQRDSKNRVLVDIRVPVTKKFLATLKSKGSKIVSTSSRDHSIIAYVGLDKIESLAESKDVKFIMPAAEAITN